MRVVEAWSCHEKGGLSIFPVCSRLELVTVLVEFRFDSWVEDKARLNFVHVDDYIVFLSPLQTVQLELFQTLTVWNYAYRHTQVFIVFPDPLKLACKLSLYSFQMVYVG